MTKMLEKAFDAVRRLDPVAQDEIARTLMTLVGADELPPVVMTDSERTAITVRDAPARGRRGA